MFNTSEFIILAFIICLAYVVRGITGFGSALIAVPLLAFFMPLSTVVPMIVLLDYLASLSHGLHHRQHIQWSLVLPLLPFSLMGIALALYLLGTLELGLLKQALGVFVISYGIYSLLINAPHQHRNRLWAIPAGSFGGLIGALFGTGGPFYVIYLQLQGLDKTAFRATVASIFLIDGGMRLAGYTVSGFYSKDTLMLAAIALPIMFTALYLGGHIHTNLKPTIFRKAIAVLLIGSGFGLLLN